MKSYSTYIFDWDGCLAKTLDIWLTGYRLLLKQRNIIVQDQEITAHFGDWNASSKLGVSDVDQFWNDMDSYIAGKMPSVAVYPHVFKTLTYLDHASRQICMLSSSLRQYITQALDHHNLTTYFDVIITGEEVTKHKPNPEGINKIITCLNADLKTTVMIGDSDKDIQAAHHAGIDSVLFYPPEHSVFYQLDTLKQSNPTHVIADHRELLS